MKNNIKYLYLLILILALFSCANKSTSYNNDLAEDCINSEYVNFKQANIEQKQNLVIDRKIIKEGDISFETSNLIATRNIINKAIKQTNAYISDERTENNYNTINSFITIRVPAENFEILLDSISRKVEKFDAKTIKANDVTEEYVDISSRLKAKKEVENRYLQLLAKAYSIEDILKIEEKLAIIREEIESVEGRLNVLDKSVVYSTLSIKFYKQIEVSDGYGSKFKDSLIYGWNGLVAFFIGLLCIWPIIIIGIFLIVFFIKRRKNKKLKRKLTEKT